MQFIRTIMIVGLAAVLLACGGGGGGGSNPDPGNPPADPNPTPTPDPSPSPSPTTFQWSASPMAINTSEEEVYEPHLAYDQAGNGLAIWVSVASNGGTSLLWSRYSVNDLLWSTPSPIYANAYPVKYLGGPGNQYWESTTDLAVTDNGDAWAVWTESESTSLTVVMTSHFDSASLTWTTPEPLNQDIAKSAHSVRVATNGSGQTVATWLEVDAQTTSAFPQYLLGVYASLYDAVSGWSTPVKLDDGTQEYYAPGTVYDHTPQPAVTASGNMVVVWHYYTNGFGLWSAEYSVGAWNPAHRIDDGTTSSNREINLSLDALDKVHVVWVARDASGNDRVLYSRLNDGSSTWLTPASLETIEGSAYAPKVAANNNGRVVVSWLNDNTSLDLYATQFDPDQQLWATPVNVAAGVSSSKQPTVALDNDDNVLILWQYSNLWYVRYTPTDGWAAKASVPAGRHGMHLSLVPQGTASLQAIWAYVESGVAPKLYVSNYE